ncbi:TPA: hypothetical protein ACJJMJ_001926, partial [Neisseria meningitidis]
FHFVIPAQAGIQCVEFQLFRINFETLIASFPQKWESSFFEFQSFPINCLSIECLDSRLRGNDGGAVAVFSGKYPQAKILLFSQKQKTKNRNLKFVIPAQAGIQCVELQLFRINFETLIPSFPRKWESSFLSFSHSR